MASKLTAYRIFFMAVPPDDVEMYRHRKIYGREQMIEEAKHLLEHKMRKDMPDGVAFMGMMSALEFDQEHLPGVLGILKGNSGSPEGLWAQ